jgi:hypothetical protein
MLMNLLWIDDSMRFPYLIFWGTGFNSTQIDMCCVQAYANMKRFSWAITSTMDVIPAKEILFSSINLQHSVNLR